MGRKRDLVEYMAQVLENQKEYLNLLDTAIGDGDHGNNMCTGMNAALDYLEEVEDESDPQQVLRAIGDAFAENVGGASGPLYAIAFKKASQVCSKDTPFNIDAIIEALAAAIAGVEKRGRVIPGEKTLLDVLVPVFNCFVQGKLEGRTLNQCLAEASKAAKAAADNTKGIQATKGRASYLGVRSIGHLDPGAVGLQILVREFAKYYQH